MESNKKEKVHPAVKLLNEDIRDKELQKRYDGFKREQSRLVDLINDMIVQHNKDLATYETIKSCIVLSHKLGFSTKEQLDTFVKLNDVLTLSSNSIKESQKQLDEANERVSGLKSSSDDRFYQHWRHHKALGLTDKSFPDWKFQYKDIII